MGGKSTSDTQQSQNSTTAPWAPAQPTIQGILSQLQGYLPQTGATGAQTGALSTIEGNAGNFNQFNPQVASLTGDLLNGGGANGQAPAVSSNLDQYKNWLTPYANGSMVGNNPALQAQLDTIRSDVSNQVNGQFAAAGRDFSGMNQQALGRGIAQGEAPVIANQYNQDVGNQMNAAGSLYGAGNTSAGILSGLNQQSLANRQAGVGGIPGAMSAQNSGANEILQAEAQRLGIPIGNLGLLAQLGIPIAGLGSQSQGTGTSNTTNQMSGADQFMKIASGIGSFIPKGPMNFSF